MQVRFTQDYQGQWTGPHFYRGGHEYDLDDVTAHLLIDDGRAVEVKPPAPVEPYTVKDSVSSFNRAEGTAGDAMVIEPLPAQTVPMSKRARGGKRGDVL